MIKTIATLVAIFFSFAFQNSFATPVDMEQSARGACMLFIKQALHDPDSAEFESAAYSKMNKNGTWTVQRHLRARNVYNALRKEVIECRMSLISGNWKLLSIKQIE